MNKIIIKYLQKILDCTFLTRIWNNLGKYMIGVIYIVCLSFLVKVAISSDGSICYKLLSGTLMLIVVLFFTFQWLKTILKFIWDSSISKRFRKHYADFRYIWIILLALAFVQILLTPVWDWRYSRFFLIALVAFILWNLLDAIWGQTILGKALMFFLIVFFALGLFWIMPQSPLSWIYNKRWCQIMLLGLATLITLRPMNAVYGLMGTSGSIRLFFLNFLLISLIFSLIYYFGFFKTAGITYDVNQPHIDFLMYADTTEDIHNKFFERVSIKRDTIYLEHQSDSMSFTEKVIHITTDTRHYQKIDFGQVWRSTIMTTLTQESTDLLSIATVHNAAVESTNVGLDKEKSELFECILIFHIIISWIFFGVFISLLYNKFRYES